MTSPDQTPRHLTDVDALAQLSFLVQATLERRAARAEVSLSLTRLLGILRDRRPTMYQLAQLMDLDKSSVTGLVERAERRGLTLRSRSPHDGRSVLVTLTEEGRALVAQVAAEFGRDIEQLLGALTATDRAALTEIAERVLITDAGTRGIDLFATEQSGT
ncbi:MAG TPA: MarR family transcriptional regulator [Solirubrobacteraceae bacterium]|nr:MarR family transcriptional regulator [Solirubrobacteraceae bacterium]